MLLAYFRMQEKMQQIQSSSNVSAELNETLYDELVELSQRVSSWTTDSLDFASGALVGRKTLVNERVSVAEMATQIAMWLQMFVGKQDVLDLLRIISTKDVPSSFRLKHLQLLSGSVAL